jgi:hypothetical protein
VHGPAGRARGGAVLLSIIFLIGLLPGCGGGGSSSAQQNTTSGVKVRAFVSNSFSGVLSIVDAQHDTLVQGHNIQVGSQPGVLLETPDKTLTLVFDNGSNTLVFVSNLQEQQIHTVTLAGTAASIVVSPDSKFAFAAIPGAISLGQPAGELQVVDLVNAKLTSTLNVASVIRLVINHAGTRLLAFGENSDSVTLLNVAHIGQGIPATVVSGFDRPVFGVFAEDDSIAYIMNCGPECGGSSSSVTALHMDTNTPGASVSVAGATVGTLVNGSVLVAGNASGSGTLQSVTTSPLTASSAVPIGDGFHSIMAMGTNNKLFIGAQGCSQSRRGCVTVFDTGAGSAVVDTNNGDVTGIAPIANRNVVYVIEGGELRIFDTTTSQPSNSAFIDIVGKAVDVKEVD